MYSPSLEPYTPWLVLAFEFTRGKRPLLFLPSPEEEGIVGMPRPVDRDIACPVARNRFGDIRQRGSNLEVCTQET